MNFKIRYMYWRYFNTLSLTTITFIEKYATKMKAKIKHIYLKRFKSGLYKQYWLESELITFNFYDKPPLISIYWVKK